MSGEVIVLKRETWKDGVLVMVEVWNPIPDTDPVQYECYISRDPTLAWDKREDTVDSPQ